MAIPTPATPLAYSDYLTGGAIVSGAIGASEFLQNLHPEIVGYAGLATTILVLLAAWLRAKGD